MQLEDWEYKYPKIRKIHEGRVTAGFLQTLPVHADVRSFIRLDDWAIRDLLQTQVFKMPFVELLALSDGIKLMRCQDWVVQNITYQADLKGWGQREFWQFPCETLATKRGDCEDGCFLLHTMLLNANIDARRLRSTAGWASAPNGQRGGHMYLTYCRGEDWVPIDWCYYPESKQTVEERTPIKKVEHYQDVWFSISDTYCWSHVDTPVIYGRVRKQ
jgi:hypothetical protein